MIQNFKSYIYIDSDGINSLFEQLPNDTMLPAIGTANSKMQPITKISSEVKIESILHHLCNGKIETLADMMNHINISGNLVAFQAMFQFKYAYDDNEKAFVTEYDISQNPYRYEHLSYFFISKSPDSVWPPYSVETCFGSSKMVRTVRHITHQIKYNKYFIFYILGEMNNKGKGIFYIKPFAVWRATEDRI